MSTPFCINFNENYLWVAILICILIVFSVTSRQQSEYFEAPFIPSQPWIEYPEYPAPYRGDQLYLGGSTKCFSCEKDVIKRGLPTYLSHPTKCFDCDGQAASQYGSWAGHFGQNNKCFSCEAQYAPNPFKLESWGVKIPPGSGASPYCDPEQMKQCGKNPQVSRYGRADGQSFSDRLSTDGVGLVKGFGRADGQGDYHEGDTQNPIGYTLA